jgi:glutathione synthase
MAYDILVLTDHRLHSAENSVYALSAALLAHPLVNSVDIASRGLEENAMFFDGHTNAVLSVIPAVSRMTYRRGRNLLESSASEAELADYDFVFLRLPPPIPVRLFRSLPEAMPEDHIVNEPSGIIRTASKAFLLEVAELCPPMHMIRKRSDALDFLGPYNAIVLKPLYGYAGNGVVKFTKEHAEMSNGNRLFHRIFFKEWSPPYIGMQFLDNVAEGDKRTIVVNNKIMGSALRKPTGGKWTCNIANGGVASHAIPDATDHKIATRLSTELGKQGILIFGFDTLMNNDGQRVLSEVNTMSIGGLKQIRDAEEKPILKEVVSEVMQHLDRIWFGTDK